MKETVCSETEQRTLFDDPKSDLILPSIVLAEAMFIVEKGRSAIPLVEDLLNDVQGDSRIEIFSLTTGILEESVRLAAVPEIHDRLIVATGVYLQNLGDAIEVLTKDNEIIVSALLPVCWS